MRKCLRCNAEMVEDLAILTTDAMGIRVGEKGIFKGSLGKVSCAICPECGFVETYVNDTSKIKDLASEQE